MVMHVREQTFVPDVNMDEIARKQAYVYHSMDLEEDKAVETGIVVSMPTKDATNLLQELSRLCRGHSSNGNGPTMDENREPFSSHYLCPESIQVLQQPIGESDANTQPNSEKA